MNRSALSIIAILFLMSGLTAGAELCTADQVPAATLLLPYFEVDLANSDGVTTVFAITNASAEAGLAHVTVWTDLSVPVLDFNIYLTGYDVQTVNLRDIFVDGIVPVTADDPDDPNDTISPQGPFSQDIAFPVCNFQLPLPTPAMSSIYTDHVQSALTGQPSSLLGGLCSGVDYGDSIARGYITIDTVSFCSLQFPGDAGYFVSGGLGTATNQNILIGDYAYYDPANNFAQGEPMVHIEADDTAFLPGDYTFYGRYVGGVASDNREPLATAFAARYVEGGDFSTQFIVWRDSKHSQNPFTCGTLPNPYPLAQTQVLAFDEEENPSIDTSTCTISPCPIPVTLIPFPWEAQRVNVGGPSLPVPFASGWMYLNLNTTTLGDPFGPIAQAWVTVIQSSAGRFSTGFAAAQLANACDGTDVIVGAP